MLTRADENSAYRRVIWGRESGKKITLAPLAQPTQLPKSLGAGHSASVTPTPNPANQRCPIHPEFTHTPRLPPIHIVPQDPARPTAQLGTWPTPTAKLRTLPFRSPFVTPALSHIVGPSIQPPEALRVSASDTLDIHLQDQLKPWPQQGKHLLPVPAGLIRIRDQLARSVGGVVTMSTR